MRRLDYFEKVSFVLFDIHLYCVTSRTLINLDILAAVFFSRFQMTRSEMRNPVKESSRRGRSANLNPQRKTPVERTTPSPKHLLANMNYVQSTSSRNTVNTVPSRETIESNFYPSQRKVSYSPDLPKTLMVQTNAYAGAKFSDPPSPKLLPKPPTHWTASNEKIKTNVNSNFLDMTCHLKMLLNV